MKLKNKDAWEINFQYEYTFQVSWARRSFIEEIKDQARRTARKKYGLFLEKSAYKSPLWNSPYFCYSELSKCSFVGGVALWRKSYVPLH